MRDDWQEMPDKDLARSAGKGLRGQGAVVEASLRLRESLSQQMSATNRLTKWIVGLTVVIVILTLVTAWPILSAVLKWAGWVS